MEQPGATPVRGVPPYEGSVPYPVPVQVEKSSGFLAWPTPKAFAGWVALLLAVVGIAVPLASAFFVKNTIYDTDKSAQQQVNARVDKESTVIQVHLDALKSQLDAHTADSQRQNDQINHKLDDLLRRR